MQVRSTRITLFTKIGRKPTPAQFGQNSIAVVLRLIRPVNWNSKVGRLVLAEYRQLGTDLFQMQTRYFLIQMLGRP